MPTDHPWHSAYLAAFGDVPDSPNQRSNVRNDLPANLSFGDLVDIKPIDTEPSVPDLLARIRDPQCISAVSLTRIRLPTRISAGYGTGLSGSSRFTWGQSSASTRYGPNLLVVYSPGSVADLALIWNLRARYAHPAKLPLAVPLTDTIHDDVAAFGSACKLAVTSFSIATADLRELVAHTDFEVVEPWDLLGEICGYCVASTETAQFSQGRATVSAFSPTDIETLGDSFLGGNNARWMTLTTVVSKNPLPASQTMRRTRSQEPGYLHGKIVHVGELNGFATLQHPSGLEVLRALAADRSLRARVCNVGQSAENLIRTADAELSMFTYPGVTTLLRELTRPEEPGYMNFDRMKGLLELGERETAVWTEWAARHRLVLRGVEARCKNCAHAQWRPLADAVPELVCHGCGLIIETPFGSEKIEYQYRASEVLLRAMNHGVLPAVLAIRHISHILDRGDGTVFGAYPGVELLDLDSDAVVAVLDVVIVLASGQWLVGACQADSRGLNETELQKLWTAADRAGAPATFSATLDRSADCSGPWKVTTDPNGRPHFALTAEHLYDLPAPAPVPPDAAFGECLLRKTDDPSKHARAPWDVDE